MSPIPSRFAARCALAALVAAPAAASAHEDDGAVLYFAGDDLARPFPACLIDADLVEYAERVEFECWYMLHDTPPVHSLALEVEVAPGNNAGTRDPVWVCFGAGCAPGGGRQYLNRAGPDFRPGQRRVYDLMMPWMGTHGPIVGCPVQTAFPFPTLDQIREMSFGVSGDDGLRVNALTLLINDVPAYTRRYENGNSFEGDEFTIFDREVVLEHLAQHPELVRRMWSLPTSTDMRSRVEQTIGDLLGESSARGLDWHPDYDADDALVVASFRDGEKEGFRVRAQLESSFEVNDLVDVYMSFALAFDLDVWCGDPAAEDEVEENELRITPGALRAEDLYVASTGNVANAQARRGLEDALADASARAVPVRVSVPSCDDVDISLHHLVMRFAPDVHEWVVRLSRGHVPEWDPLESTCRHASLSIL